jgi:MFS family permease
VGRIIALSFCATFSFAMLESTFALVAEHAWSMTARTVGLLFGLIGVVGIVIQGGLIGQLVNRFGERPLLAAGYSSTACGMVLLSFTREGALWFADGWGPILLGCVLLALGTSLANPSMTSLVSRSTSPDEQGKVLGVNQSLSALGRAAAPTIGGWLYAHWFAGGAFAAGAVVMGSALLLAAPQVLRPAQRG